MPMSAAPAVVQSAPRPSRPLGIGTGNGARARPHNADEASWAFEARRRAILQAGSRIPLTRLAALLIAISRNNSYEGRDPTLVPETLNSGFVADLLGLSIGTLASLLRELADRGLVEAAPSSGLYLTDLDGLEGLVEAH